MFGRKDTNIFTEIGKFFRNNDSNKAMNAISGVILGFKALFLCVTDGKSQMALDYAIVGEKGKDGRHGLRDDQLSRRFTIERGGESHTALRINEYGQSKIQIAIQMIRRAIGNRVRFRYVLADSWFACAEIIGFIKSRRIGCHYLGMVKMGKAKYTYGGDWNALITTDLTLEFPEAYRIYSMRWSVEVLFKDCKTNLGLWRYQQRDFAAQIACTAITAMQYNILSVARRLSDYETVGGLFRDAAGCGTQLSVTERIWGLIQELAVKLAEYFCKSIDFIMDLIINGSDKLAEIRTLYNDNCKSDNL